MDLCFLFYFFGKCKLVAMFQKVGYFLHGFVFKNQMSRTPMTTVQWTGTEERVSLLENVYALLLSNISLGSHYQMTL